MNPQKIKSRLFWFWSSSIHWFEYLTCHSEKTDPRQQCFKASEVEELMFYLTHNQKDSHSIIICIRLTEYFWFLVFHITVCHNLRTTGFSSTTVSTDEHLRYSFSDKVRRGVRAPLKDLRNHRGTVHLGREGERDGSRSVLQKGHTQRYRFRKERYSCSWCDLVRKWGNLILEKFVAVDVYGIKVYSSVGLHDTRSWSLYLNPPVLS